MLLLASSSPHGSGSRVPSAFLISQVQKLRNSKEVASRSWLKSETFSWVTLHSGTLTSVLLVLRSLDMPFIGSSTAPGLVVPVIYEQGIALTCSRAALPGPGAVTVVPSHWWGWEENKGVSAFVFHALSHFNSQLPPPLKDQHTGVWKMSASRKVRGGMFCESIRIFIVFYKLFFFFFLSLRNKVI